MNLQEQYKYVIESLKLLAARYEDQEVHLPSFADIPEDVYSTFENAFLLLPQLIENEYFNFKSISYFLRTYNKLCWTERNIGFENIELFKSHKDWEEVRRLARETLRQLNEPIENHMQGYI